MAEGQPGQKKREGWGGAGEEEKRQEGMYREIKTYRINVIGKPTKMEVESEGEGGIGKRGIEMKKVWKSVSETERGRER